MRVVLFITNGGRNGLMRATSRREETAFWIINLSELKEVTDGRSPCFPQRDLFAAMVTQLDDLRPGQALTNPLDGYLRPADNTENGKTHQRQIHLASRAWDDRAFGVRAVERVACDLALWEDTWRASCV
jgi:hypothetical protein